MPTVNTIAGWIIGRKALVWAWALPLVFDAFFTGEPLIEFSGFVTMSLFLSGVSIGASLESHRRFLASIGKED